ncbi:McrB family protein [Nocardia sp. NPDC003482]
MARILRIVPSGQRISAHKLEEGVTCQYKVIETSEGQTLVHLSTFGSDKRESQPKSSQSMQFDKEHAMQLIDILTAAFGSRDDEEDREIAIPAEFPEATEEMAAELYVPRTWLQECIDLLRDRPQLIFYGPPGTGKTYIARKIAEHISGAENVKVVQFHPSYSYEDFFEGFRPSRSEAGQITYEVHNGPLKLLAEKARQDPGSLYTLVIDEINRGNLAKIFGELYFLLEYRDGGLNLMYSDTVDATFTLPKNLVIIGTMNTADRSIALIDSAMRRRFAFVALHPSEEPTKSILRKWLADHDYGPEIAEIVEHLNARIPDEEFKIGPSYFMRPAAVTEPGIELTWRTSIMPLLEEYHFGNPELNVHEYYALDNVRTDAENSESSV